METKIFAMQVVSDDVRSKAVVFIYWISRQVKKRYMPAQTVLRDCDRLDWEVRAMGRKHQSLVDRLSKSANHGLVTCASVAEYRSLTNENDALPALDGEMDGSIGILQQVTYFPSNIKRKLKHKDFC